ncbi:glycosyltransferase family 2 protein [Bacillus cereus]|uniref:glycosyltransferase family 2 protein n=1 Tax=Bacillus cereus TaxID=1396 RepID=UPI002570EE15|nr:glycosyltransferase family 2 protein [Bacillus cereus]WJE20181.1 glycosyltransferase family 2 protein [Bacillus cereus]
MCQFSIIIPTYNVDEYIEECITSILKQTFDDFEIVIVDDCSSDNTVEVINRLSDSRLKLLKNEVNKGPSYSRNKAIKHSNGKYIMIVDSDDLILEDRLEIMNTYIKEEDPDILFDNFYYFIDGEEYYYANGYEQKGILKNSLQSIDVKQFIEYDLGIFKGVMKKEFIIKNGILYNENCRLAEDFLFYLEYFANEGKVLFIPEALYLYRQRKNSLITTLNKEYYVELIKVTEYAIREVEKQTIDSNIRSLLEARMKKQHSAYNYYLFRDNLKNKKFKDALVLMFKDYNILAKISKDGVKKVKSKLIS